jgi:DNA-binding transcriptional regulator PaaX
VGKNSKKTEIINSLLRFIATGSLIATALVAPNVVQILDKPLYRYYKKLGKDAREQEYKRLLGYMNREGLVVYNTSDINGIKLTQAGVKRGEKVDLDQLIIPKPLKWDRQWRVVFFDIPESNKSARDCLTRKLKDIGFLQLQKSAWIHPFPCHDEVAAIAEQYGVRKYVTFIDTSYIDSHDKLLEAFSSYF